MGTTKNTARDKIVADDELGWRMVVYIVGKKKRIMELFRRKWRRLPLHPNRLLERTKKSHPRLPLRLLRRSWKLSALISVLVLFFALLSPRTDVYALHPTAQRCVGIARSHARVVVIVASCFSSRNLKVRREQERPVVSGKRPIRGDCILSEADVALTANVL